MSRPLSSALAALALTLAACNGADGSENANTMNNSNGMTTTNGSTSSNNTTTTNGATNNTVADTTNTTTDTTPVRTEPYISQLRYYRIGIGETDLSIFVDGTIERGVNLGPGVKVHLSPADAEAFEAAHLTMENIERMRNGWGCSEAPDDNTVWFQARIQDGGSTTELQEVTGCEIDEDPEVLAIIKDIERLAFLYL